MPDEVTISVFGLFHPKSVVAGSQRIENRAGKLWLADEARPSIQFPGGATISVPGKIARRFPGFIRIQPVDDELRILVTLPIETAVAAAVEAEMGQVPLEAAKAQAVASRTYYAVNPRHAPDFDFCDTTHCQVLKDIPTESTAAAQTRGMLLAYQEHFFTPMFFRSCGGKTKRPSHIGLPDGPYPYAEVECAACSKGPVKWTAALNGLPVPRSENERLEVGRKLGWGVVRSNDFFVTSEGLLEGKGEGHGIGLCQRGAIAMAAAGHDFQSILRHYFPRTSVQR